METSTIVLLAVNIILFVLMIVFHYLNYKETAYSVKEYKSGLGLYFFLSGMSLVMAIMDLSIARTFFDVNVGWAFTIASIVIFGATWGFLFFYFLKKVKQNEAAQKHAKED